MKKSTAKRLSLAFTIGVSLLAVFSASIATFTWFQAEANAEVHAESSSTTITTNKPDDFTFYAYKGNTLSSWASQGTFANDFVAVTSATLSTYTSFTNFVPGQNYVYAIMAEQTTSLSVAINKIISNDASKQGIAYTRTTYSGNAVNIGWAIDMFEYDVAVSHGSVPSYSNYSAILTKKVSDANYSDRFDLTEANAGTTLSAAGTGSTPNKVITLGTPIGIYNNSVASLNYNGTTSALSESNDIFVFFSVVYSDDNSTYYKEVKSNVDSSEIIVAPTNANRYFVKDTGGNSNCYAGLKFALSEVSITIG